ncbi:hypothetical protein VTK26DRAFT_3833 [Humicola hyalothermophila]
MPAARQWSESDGLPVKILVKIRQGMSSVLWPKLAIPMSRSDREHESDRGKMSWLSIDPQLQGRDANAIAWEQPHNSQEQLTRDPKQQAPGFDSVWSSSRPSAAFVWARGELRRNRSWPASRKQFQTRPCRRAHSRLRRQPLASITTQNPVGNDGKRRKPWEWAFSCFCSFVTTSDSQHRG